MTGIRLQPFLPGVRVQHPRGTLGAGPRPLCCPAACGPGSSLPAGAAADVGDAQVTPAGICSSPASAGYRPLLPGVPGVTVTVAVPGRIMR